MFKAEEVWVAAIAAQRINGEYLQHPDEWSSESPRLSNKSLIKQWLYSGETPTVGEDYQMASACHTHVKGYLFLEIAGTITDFQHIALRIAQIESFTTNNLFEFSVIACLPIVMQMDLVRQTIDMSPFLSLPGNIGDKVDGDITVVSSTYNRHYRKYKVVAILGETLVEFWCRSDLEGVYNIGASIKSVNADHTTQINHITHLTEHT
jgi:hypothetical protein